MGIDFYQIKTIKECCLDKKIGLISIRDRFFRNTPKDLFNTLVSRPQKLADIIYRQAIFRDFISHVDISDLLKTQDDLEELASQHNSSVKHWKIDRSWGYDQKVPFIYNPKKLDEIAKNFSKVSENAIARLSEAKSTALVSLREHFAQFVDPNSEIYKQWQKDRIMLTQEEKPFFGLIYHDTWSNEIDSIVPLALISNNEELQKTIKEAVQNGTQNASILIEGKKYPLKLTDHHFSFKQKFQRIKSPKQKYYAYDLFGGIFDHIKETRQQLEQLHFYREGMAMYTHFTKEGLPMCLPQLSDSNQLVIDIQDFYPFFEDLRPSKYVLNSLRLDPENPVALVTGLNSGGKSTLLRSFGCIVSMSRSGLPIPAKSAEISNIEKVIYQETVGDDYEDRLSTFRNQTRTFSRLFSKLPKKPNFLLLLNEPLPGTDYETEKEGMLDSLRTLAQLYQIPTLIESHCISAGYAVQKDKKKYSGIKLVKFQIDPKTNKPDHILRTGVGKSEGTYVLKEEGLTYAQLKKDYNKKKD